MNLRQDAKTWEQNAWPKIPPPPSGGSGVTSTWSTRAICPDLLRLSDIGEADGWRGRTVRGFFRLLKLATGL